MSLLAGLSACNSGSTITRATGKAYEVIVVMDNAVWNETTGSAVKEELTSPIPFLMQSESSMRITHVTHDQFNGLFKYVRNILVVNVDKSMYTKVSFLKEKNKWAVGQSVVYLNAPDGKMIEDYLEENDHPLVTYFTKEEMSRAKEYLLKSYSPLVMDKVKEKFGITLNAPSDMKKCKDTLDCLWFSNDATVGRMDLLVYSFPFEDHNTFTLDYLVAKRDTVTKRMIPGAFPNSYMTTEKRIVDYSASVLHGKYCGVIRGWWRMEGDMMGGPFVSYARVDEESQRVIVTEGFVYEPEKPKGFYVRRLEAALQTTLFPSE
ncbi:MAG: DUF4837 family protein, partial [Tannerella sp.]|nr:DUF4837 family protein [Tannerella sp.]